MTTYAIYDFICIRNCKHSTSSTQSVEWYQKLDKLGGQGKGWYWSKSTSIK